MSAAVQTSTVIQNKLPNSNRSKSFLDRESQSSSAVKDSHLTQEAGSHILGSAGAQTVTPNKKFDPTKHQMPRIDVFGWNLQIKKKPGDDGSNILTQNVRIPDWWSRPGMTDEDKKTRTKLAEQRHTERIPHISYDLDGDGYVGGKDYVVAKHFDKDGDGKLNAEERKNAIEAIKNGFESNFVWNVEVQGGHRPFRIMQKRGVIVDAEDFIPVRSTYPVHPDSLKDPKYHTTHELKAERKKTYIDAINEQKRNWELANPSSIERPAHIRSEFYKDNPHWQSIKQRREEQIVEARQRDGALIIDTTDVKETYEKIPSLKFVTSPPAPSKTLLEKTRKEEMLHQLNQYEAKVGHMPDAKARLEEREGCFLRKTYKPEGVTGRTKGHIDKERKDQVIENLTKKYGTVTIGIHGQELPKYSEIDTSKEWWRNTSKFTENPEFGQSRLILKENQKYWAQNDQMRLADVNADNNAAPIDPFKKEHVPQKYKFEITPHVQSISHWKPKYDASVEDINTDAKGNHRTLKWSELEKMFRCEGDDRLIDKIYKQAMAYEKNMLESEEKRQALIRNTNRSPRHQKHGKTHSVHEYQAYQSSPQANDKIKIQRNSVQRAPMSGGTDISPLGSAFNQGFSAKASLTTRLGAQTMGNSMPIPGVSFSLGGTVALMGKTTLFSRVALSPGGHGPEKKGNQTGKRGGENSSQADNDTNASTMVGGGQLNKTMRSSITTNTFKDAIQKGVLSGAGILKK